MEAEGREKPKPGKASVYCGTSSDQEKLEVVDKSDLTTTEQSYTTIQSTTTVHPPSEQVYLYQLVSATPDSPLASPGLSQLPDRTISVSSEPVPDPSPPEPKPKPCTIHQYYDAYQWKEFNPEDTIVGDATDTFIVYFRYASKSIGAKRTAWMLPKHPKLIKIMQDCLPDLDWRRGEDLLVLLDNYGSDV